MKLSSKLTAALAVITLAFGVTPAKASTNTLTIEQMEQTQGFADWVYKHSQSDVLWRDQPGSKINVTMTMSGLFSIGVLDVAIEANHEGSHMTIESISSNGSVDYYQGKFYKPLQAACDDFFETAFLLFDGESCQDSAFLDKVRKNLTNKSAAYVSSTTSELASGPLSPQTEIIDAGAYSDSFTMLSTWLGMYDLEGALFSEVTSTPNPTDGTKTDYTLSISKDASGQGFASAVTIVQTFDSTGLIVDTKISVVQNSFSASMSYVLEVTREIWDEPAIFTPNPAEVITQSAFNKAGNKVVSEVNALNQADLIVNGAKTAAKKAKKVVASSYLIASAKKLKIKYASIKNGLKISAKYSGATTYVCITAYKGKTSTKTC